MTNKELTKEIIWLITGLLLSIVVAILIIPSEQRSFFISDIYLGSRPSESAGFIGKLTGLLTYIISFAFLFPVLFIILSIRGAVYRFSNRSFNIYLGLICFVSILVSILFLITSETILTLFAGSYTIYPPLSSLPDVGTPPHGLQLIFFCCIAFIIIQLIVLGTITSKLAKQK